MTSLQRDDLSEPSTVAATVAPPHDAVSERAPAAAFLEFLTGPEGLALLAADGFGSP